MLARVTRCARPVPNELVLMNKAPHNVVAIQADPTDQSDPTHPTDQTASLGTTRNGAGVRSTWPAGCDAS